MKINKWTVGLAAAGLVSLPVVLQAEEKLSPVQTALASTIISGYVDTSAQWNFGTGNYAAPRFAFDQGKQDGFNLNAVKLSIEKPLSEEQWAAGYKFDMWFGPDANALHTGSIFSGDTGLENSDFAIRQAYVQLRAPVGNGLDFKVGVFDTIIGYESHDAANDPNYTRSYGYTIEPTTHDGILASYRFCDFFSASAGIANTHGPTINDRNVSNDGKNIESYKTYMGSVALTAPTDWGWVAGSTLYGGVINGFKSGTGNMANYYAGLTLATPVKGLRVGLSYDYANIYDGRRSTLPPVTPAVTGSGQKGYAWSTAGYLSFQPQDSKWSFHARGEYFAQSTTLQKNEMTPNAADPTGSFAATGTGTFGLGFAGPTKIVAGTATVQYDLWKNVISRLEFRWDHSADGRYFYGAQDGTGSAATNSKPGPGTRLNAYMVAMNIIYKF